MVAMGDAIALPEIFVGTPRLVTIGWLVPISNPEIIFRGAVLDAKMPVSVNAPVAEVVVYASPASKTLSLSKSWKIVAPAT